MQFDLKLTIFIITLFATQNVNAALSVATVNVIEGRPPLFVPQSIAQKLGFVVQGVHYSEAEGNINENTVKKFDKNLSLRDFVVTSLSPSDFTVEDNYFDEDGDEAHPLSPFTMDPIRYEWTDNQDRRITDLYLTLDCGSGLNLPLKLNITLPNIQAHSQYGKPRESEPITLTKSYRITTDSAICFAQPNQMAVNHGNTWQTFDGSSWQWNSYSSERDPVYGGGYNPDEFNPVYGFKYHVPVKFPTTGFPKAKFKLIMLHDNADYKFESEATPSESVEVDANGNVTLNSKPSAPVTIKATLKADTSVVYDYVFDPTTVWVVPQPNVYSLANAVTKCGGLTNLPTRAELTNSPQITFPKNNQSVPENSYTRAIGGGIFNEWGWADSGNYKNTYPGSFWVAGYYWTQDISVDNSYQFVVDADAGSVDSILLGGSVFLACRG
ncbi:hypothetical protein RCS94_07325 [Orbaceae bacterium ac157xtp]